MQQLMERRHGAAEGRAEDRQVRLRRVQAGLVDKAAWLTPELHRLGELLCIHAARRGVADQQNDQRLALALFSAAKQQHARQRLHGTLQVVVGAAVSPAIRRFSAGVFPRQPGPVIDPSQLSQFVLDVVDAAVEPERKRRMHGIRQDGDHDLCISHRPG